MSQTELKIIFQNENLIALDKPSGVLTVPSRLADKDERPVLGLQLQTQLKQQIFPVHRLDFEVSGLVLFALNAKSHAIASSWFEKKQVMKIYRALTSSQNFDHWPQNISCVREVIDQVMITPALWTSKIQRGKKRTFESPHGDKAETLAQLVQINKLKNHFEWKLHPLTGRSHQLRFELSRHGFPILGDKLYGSSIENNLPSIALRAIEISFEKIKNGRLGLPDTLKVNKEIKFFDEGIVE